MDHLTWKQGSRAILLAAAVLATGCAGDANPPAALQVAGFSALQSHPDFSGAAVAPSLQRPDVGRSWISPLPQNCYFDRVLPPCGLLYVSDYATGRVVIYQRDKLVGTLTGFDGPDGLCSDLDGNVFVTNNRSASIVEYGHGKTTPIRTLSDPGVYPVSCSANPITGSLAVTNIASYGSGQGSVAIYHREQGTPLLLYDHDIYFVYFCAFDAAGDLYIDGLDTSGSFHLAVMRHGERKFRRVTLDTQVNFPGDIAFDGPHIVIADQRYGADEAALYRINVDGGAVLKTTVLDDVSDLVGYWLHNGGVIGADVAGNAVDLYRYPQGGKPALRRHRFHDPYGVTVSIPH